MILSTIVLFSLSSSSTSKFHSNDSKFDSDLVRELVIRVVRVTPDVSLTVMFLTLTLVLLLLSSPTDEVDSLSERRTL